MILDLIISPLAQIALDRLVVHLNCSVDDIVSKAILNYQQYLEICEDDY
ncbi:hypothetical protein LCGC14_2640150 [marine sediment metagenome]|uniref:Uncharacterized protein n=1 Tax=marine sediment metagenome TaxID=412755 RepID=A0A0F8ZXX3_9ZZZZ